VKAKTHNRKSKNSELRQRRGEIEIISPFCVSTSSGLGHPPACEDAKKKTRISESRKPEEVETQNGEMISISPLR
jgi:hypothetical protein